MARANYIKFRKLRHQARLIIADIGVPLILKAQGHTCPICQNHLSPKDVTVDHVYPLYMCMENSGNLLLCHYHCNQEKGDRLPTEFEIEMLVQVNERLGFESERGRYRCRQVLVNKYYKVALWHSELKERNASQHEMDKVQLKMMALEEQVGQWINK